MAFHVRDPETDSLVRELAMKRSVSLTEAIRTAVAEALQKDVDRVAERRARTRALMKEYETLPRTGLAADKAFFDELSGE